MNPEIDLNQLVDEFLRFEKYVEESKQYERVVAAPSLSDDQLFLEQDWQRFVAYKYNQAGYAMVSKTRYATVTFCCSRSSPSWPSRPVRSTAGSTKSSNKG